MDFDLANDVAVPFAYAKWSPNDWIEGTEGFELELEGAYCRFMNRLYRRGCALPDDDVFMAKTVMALSLRVWRRLKAVLIEMKKIIVINGCLTNPRFERERAERARMLRKQSEAALATHESRRQKNVSLVKFEQSLAKTSAKFQPNSPEKPNNINVTSLSEHAHLKIKSLEEEKKEEPPVSPPAGDAPKQVSLFPEPEREPARIGRVAAALATGLMASTLPLAAAPIDPPAHVQQASVPAATEVPSEKPKRAHQMRLGWRPSARTMEWAQTEPVRADPMQIEQQLLAFTDYHLAKGSKYVDWDRAFQTWMRNAREFGRLKTVQTKSGPGVNGSNYSFSGAYVGQLL